MLGLRTCLMHTHSLDGTFASETSLAAARAVCLPACTGAPSQVSKKLLLLYVQEEGRGPGSGSSEGVGSSGGGGSSSSGSSSEYSSPRCLARFVVQERIVRRWVPDAHRPA